MDGVRARENVEETARLVAGNVYALRYELTPGNHLSGNKKEAQARGNQPELSKTSQVCNGETAPRRFERQAAPEKNASVQPKNARKVHGHPHVAAAPQNDEGAAEGHEEHQDGHESDRNSCGVASRRWGPLTASAVVTIIAAIPACRGRSAASAAYVFNDEFDVWSCGCARHGDPPSPPIREP